MTAVNHVLRPRPRRTTINCVVCYGRGWHSWPLAAPPWDLFDTGHSVEIQKVDSPDVDGRTFETDDDAAGFVVTQAQWEDNPNVLLRDQCRAVLDELVYSWGEDED